MIENVETNKAISVDVLLQDYVRKYHQGYSHENEAEKIAKLWKPVDSQKLQGLLTDLLGSEPKTILDIGCGTGRFLRGLPDTWQKVGLECRPEAVEIARLLGNGQVQIHEGLAESIPLESNKFDIVTSFQVLEHVNDPVQAIDEMFRVTRPGGLVYGELPNKWHPREPHIGLVYPQILPMWLRKPYIDHFGKVNKASIEFNYLRNINYLTSRQVLAMLHHDASRVIHLTPTRLEQHIRMTRFRPFAKLMAHLGANLAGIEFVAIK